MINTLAEHSFFSPLWLGQDAFSNMKSNWQAALINFASQMMWRAMPSIMDAVNAQAKVLCSCAACKDTFYLVLL